MSQPAANGREDCVAHYKWGKGKEEQTVLFKVRRGRVPSAGDLMPSIFCTPKPAPSDKVEAQLC